MKEPLIVSAVRTPIGSFQGSLSQLRAPELGSVAIKAALTRSGLAPERVEEVVMGCVLSAGLGQAPARQAALGAGLPNSTGALTVNKVCSSGLRAISLAADGIRLGEFKVAVAGGMESMSNAPYLLPDARAGMRLGDKRAVDEMVFDGLWDIHSNQHMGSCAELCADKYSLNRKMQDEYAEESYRKAIKAIEDKLFNDEIVGVEVKGRKGAATMVDTDEEPGRVDFEKMGKLRSTFKADGTITAANASSISDGAAALLLASEDVVKADGLRPMARILAYASHAHEPEWFTTAPIGAVKKVLEKCGLTIGDIDLFEINEAFSAVTLAAMRELKIDGSKVNVTGGAVALGHPIGASGARIVVTLLHALKRLGKRRGLATLCNGGGEATALVVELI